MQFLILQYKENLLKLSNHLLFINDLIHQYKVKFNDISKYFLMIALLIFIFFNHLI